MVFDSTEGEGTIVLRSFSSKIYAHVKGLGGQQEQEAVGL